MADNDLLGAWDAVLDRYRGLDFPAAQLNVRLLEQLRPRWESHVRPDFSMLTLLFTRPDSTGYKYNERVELLLENPDRVRMALVRIVPHRRQTRPAGPVVVTGDFTKPHNALPALEALLLQLARRANAH